MYFSHFPPFNVHNVPFHVFTKHERWHYCTIRLQKMRDAEKKVINEMGYQPSTHLLIVLTVCADLGFFQNGSTLSSLSPKIGKLKKVHQTFLLLAPLHQICQSSGVFVQFTIFSKFSFKNVRTYGKDPVNRGQLMLPSGGFFIFTTPFFHNKAH